MWIVFVGRRNGNNNASNSILFRFLFARHKFTPAMVLTQSAGKYFGQRVCHPVYICVSGATEVARLNYRGRGIFG